MKPCIWGFVHPLANYLSSCGVDRQFHSAEGSVMDGEVE